MAIWIGEDAKLLIQGITGSQGSFHGEKMIEYGTDVVGGVTPGKGGQTIELAGETIAVYNTMVEAIEATDADASVIYVPPRFAAAAIMEAADAFDRLKGEGVVVCITEGIPTLDMVKAVAFVDERSGIRLIGPNCPGIITPGENGGSKIGIMPGHIHAKGRIGVISKSGTLTYEAVAQTMSISEGQSTCIGIGGDPVNGTGFIDCLEAFEADPQTVAVVLIGEIGGTAEEDAAAWAADNMNKPIVGFVAGSSAPPGKRMGHAGAIIMGTYGSAESKISMFNKANIPVAKRPAEVPVLLAGKMQKSD